MNNLNAEIICIYNYLNVAFKKFTLNDKMNL